MAVLRDLCSLQPDPISVVARSPLLVLWSRIGRFKVSDLDALLWSVPLTLRAGRTIARALEDLAAFLGAREIQFAGPVPAEWRRALR